MNKITFPRTSYDGTQITQKELELWYTQTSTIEAKILDRLNSITSATTFYKKRVLNWIKCCLHNILLANPVKLQRMAKLVDNYASDMFRYYDASAKRYKSTDFGKDLLDAFHYKVYRDNKLVELAEKLNVKSCPYCNMHYTLFAEDGKFQKDKIAKFQFDHFFGKVEYPFLSMSLYNLIPSCAVCNQGKSTEHLNLRFHPYSTDIYRQFHFSVVDPLALLSGGKKDRIELELKHDEATEKELNDYNDVFHIKTLYRRHGDIAQEVFDKVYEESYYLNTSSFKYLDNEGQDYLLRLVYGTYMSEDEIEKRPMSKFIQDMRKQALDYKQMGGVFRNKNRGNK